MFRPGTHADPTELVFTLLAGHMIATTILLDRTLTLATLLRVTLDPIRRLTIIPALLKPQLRDRADNGFVIVLDWTSKTELMLLRKTAINDGNNGSQSELGGRRWTRYGLGALGVWTEFKFAVARNEIARQEFIIPFPCGHVVCEDGFDEGIGSNEGAVLGHAGYMMFTLAPDLTGCVSCPTIRAEFVRTR